VDELKDGGWIRSPLVERAFSRVERHRFLRDFSRWDPKTSLPVLVPCDPSQPSEEALAITYSNEAFGTRFVDGLPRSSSSQPSVMADMLEALALEPGMRVLEIGTGTGYNAAVLAEIVEGDGQVVTVDVDPAIVEEAERALRSAGYGSIRVIARDGAEGVPEDAPFDRIIITVGCPDVSLRWTEQLADGGRIVVPLEHAGLHPLVALTKAGENLGGRFFAWSAFIPIRGSLEQELPWSVTMHRRDEAEVVESPAWEGFGSGTPIPGWGIPRDVMDFFLFLALRDPRADALPPRPSAIADRWEVGLASPSGTAFAGSGSIRATGDPAVYSALLTHHDAWRSSGRPAIEDWRLTLTPRGHRPTTAADFVLERSNYRQEVRLAGR
jgi:protein-L-isoaspartate(D-aspartate) O-methyltransferase